MTIGRVLPVLISVMFAGQGVFANDGTPDVNFKIFSPQTQSSELEKSVSTDKDGIAEVGASATEKAASNQGSKDDNQVVSTGENNAATKTKEGAADGEQIASRVLQGYIRVVPSGTKIPIIMDTAIDSDTSQEGDEFSARSAEDLLIDGSTVVPAGAIIKGRIAQLNAPRHLNRSGSVALKFDTVTTPDNRQLPIVANIVARGGVVHARRGLKDIAIDTGVVTLPAAAGVGIGLLAGNAGSSSIGAGGGALIGAGVGAAVGIAILLSKKGKKVDVRPGDELKIELAEDLRMPM